MSVTQARASHRPEELLPGGGCWWPSRVGGVWALLDRVSLCGRQAGRPPRCPHRWLFMCET